VIAYRATLDVPRELVQFTAKLLLAERHRRGTPRGSRALTCFWQAVLGVRWFRDEGFSHVILDGKIIPADRCKEPALSVKGQVIDLWYSGKAQRR
jgi:hypothetical protein